MPSEWTLAKRRDLTVLYEEAEISFTCVCPEHHEIFVSDEPVTCSACGRIWRYVVQLQVKEPGE